MKKIRVSAYGIMRNLIMVVVCMVVAAAAKTQARADVAYGYILPDSSWEYLTYDDIADMPLQVICYAKNEIYARNGRRFVSTELQNYFNQQYWYSGIYSPEQFSDSMLNVYETANVSLLSNREAQFGNYQLDRSYSYSVVYDYIYDHNYSDYSYDTYYVDPDSYIFYDSDRRYLSQSEISQLSLQELNYAKNEIYARRGRIFQSQELADYFGQKNWYWGYIQPNQFSESMLNGYESANAGALSNAEFSRSANGYILDQPGYSYYEVGSYTGGQVYTPQSNEYIFWDSNIRYLTDSDVSRLSLQQLNYARNEIYARRGYIFQSQELRDYFGSKYWYYGTVTSSQFSYEIFNSCEKANIELLKRYEYSINPNGYQLY